LVDLSRGGRYNVGENQPVKSVILYPEIHTKSHTAAFEGSEHMDQKALMDFFRSLDRSLFLDDEYKTSAGIDAPLPIGCGQTISQPSLVVEMTRLLDPDKDSKVLEIGTGSGYQTAFLAEFSGEVYTVELIREFTEKAQSRFKELGYDNVFFKAGDGSEGWPEHAPFDRIIVTAAAGTMPGALIKQLGSGGRMVVPVGNPGFQVLKLVLKDSDGMVSVRDIEMVRFVEMKGRYGWK
jgi:protein-L-isoaspartate(D-aspartate) O-methyltransferase